MKHGLVIGKFYPPHAGHHFVIDKAVSECDFVTVICLYSVTEGIDPSLRFQWLCNRHPDESKVYIMTAQDEFPVDYDSPEAWDNHVGIMKKYLQESVIGDPDPITDVYGSEEYIPELARRFDAIPHVVDLERKFFPVSASAVREDPGANWQFLEPDVRAWIAKQRKVVCIGAESSGTTTLAKDLAKDFGTAFVPEYGRIYSEGLGQDHVWTNEEFFHIFEMQKKMEDQIARQVSSPLLICDTDWFATQIWQQYLVNPTSDEFWDKGLPQSPSGDFPELYILTDLCPWEDDGTRVGESFRERMQYDFRFWLEHEENPIPHIFVTGDRYDRLYKANAAIVEQVLLKPFDWPLPLEEK
jgi:HTH-type transcriptional repressor of NAD biosynthesis genes